MGNAGMFRARGEIDHAPEVDCLKSGAFPPPDSPRIKNHFLDGLMIGCAATGLDSFWRGMETMVSEAFRNR